MKFKHMVSALLGVVLILSALYAIAYQQVGTRKTHAGIVVIDAMKVFGDLERPGVQFPHDKHTDTLEKQKKDCKTCHLEEDDQLIYKFQRTEDLDREVTLDIYHMQCIACHEENNDNDMASGPVECGECHQRKPEVIAAQQVINFDASLHHRHLEAADSSCETCHHDYEPDDKPHYEIGEADSCRICHKDQMTEENISYQQAAHMQCIGCHQEQAVEGNIENPEVAAIKCVGCHEKDLLDQITKLDHVPRLNRDQPDMAFIKSLKEDTPQMMDMVVFNHQDHEKNVSSCDTCHHENLNACESCHTSTGSKESNWVTLAQSMHKADSPRSCIGCHTNQVEAKECSGCHSLMDTKTHVSESRSCQTCHNIPIDRLKKDLASGEKLNAKKYASKAKAVAIDYTALPNEVVIDVIADQYKAVQFPHQQIIEAMMGKIENNTLAAQFHQGKDVICQSCHHNSPQVTDPPPKCISCHAYSDIDQGDRVPAMKTAYHRQCFACHEAMEIENPVSTDCVACHEEK